MRQLLKNIKKTRKSSKSYLRTLDEITYLAKSGLKINEIEQFLGVSINEYNFEFFNTYFKKYINLYKHLNNIELIAYITFNEKLKSDLLSTFLKKIIYPLLLIIFAFITLLTFKISVLPLFESLSDQNFLPIINLFFYTSVTLFVIVFFFIMVTIYVFNKPTYFIILYYRFYRFRLFKIIELYYICILSHLLISFDNEGLSTFQTFELINKFKGNTIISNLAYFVSADLAQGSGFETSIRNMHINENFINIIIMGMKTQNYNKLLSQYNKKMIKDILDEINILSKALLFMAYVYIGMIVIFLYKILSLPISIINNI